MSLIEFFFQILMVEFFITDQILISFLQTEPPTLFLLPNTLLLNS